MCRFEALAFRVEEVGSGIMDAVVAIESRGSRGGLRLNVESFRFGL